MTLGRQINARWKLFPSKEQGHGSASAVSRQRHCEKSTLPFHTQLYCSFYRAKQQNTQRQPDNRHQVRGNLLMSIQVRPFQPVPLECWRGWARFWLGCLLSTQGLPPAPLSHPVPATPAKGLEGKVLGFF